MPTVASARRLIVFALVNCQTWAGPLAVKLARLTETGVVSLSCLQTTMTVRAPSLARWAAKAETWSGLTTLVETLVSPNVLLLPS